MYCLTCGKKIPDNSKFCLFCGQALPEIVGEEIKTDEESASEIQEIAESEPEQVPEREKRTKFLSRAQVKEWRILSEIEGWGINTSWGDKFRKIVGQLNPPFIPESETLIFDVPVYSGITGNNIRVGQIKYKNRNLQNGFVVATDSRFVFGDHKAKWAEQIQYSEIQSVYYNRDVYTIHLRSGEEVLIKIKVPRPSLLGVFAILGGSPVDKAAISQIEHDKGVIAQQFVSIFSGFLNEIVEINREARDQEVYLIEEPEIIEEAEANQEVKIAQVAKTESVVIQREKVPAGEKAQKPSAKRNILVGTLVGFSGMAILTLITFFIIQTNVKKDNQHNLETQVALSSTNDYLNSLENTRIAGELTNTDEAISKYETQTAEAIQNLSLTATQKALENPTNTPLPEVPVAMGTRVPVHFDIITRENANSVQELARWEIFSDSDQRYSGHLSISPDGSIVATGTNEGIVILWEIMSGTIIDELSTNDDASIGDIDFSPDGLLVAATSAKSKVYLWNLTDNNLINIFDDDGLESFGIDFSEDGALLAEGDDWRTTIWRVSDGRLIYYLNEKDTLLRRVAFSPDGYAIITTDWDCPGIRCKNYEFYVEIYSVEDGSLINKKILHEVDVSSNPYWWGDIDFSPNGEYFASAAGLAFSVWTWPDFSLLLNVAEDVYCLDFSPDNQLLAVGTKEGLVQIWDISDGTLLNSLDSHLDTVIGLGFAYDGRLLITSSRDNSVRVWGIHNP